MLSRLIAREAHFNNLQGMGAARVSIICYLRMIIVFGKADEEEASSVMECLRVYGEWSGQRIVLSNSKVRFSKNVNDVRAAQIYGSIGLGRVEGD